jgi:hypothetical protein
MINHARTLLCNISGSQYQPQYLGEEYIPPQYAAAVMPSYLQAARRLIFGTQPERVFLNYRVRELMQIIHETEFADYVYDLDPRVTYWPEQQPVFFNLRKYVRAVQIAGVYGAKLFFKGDLQADHDRGIALREYTIRASQLGATKITIEYDDPHFSPTEKIVPVTAGLTAAAPISGTNLDVKVGGAAISNQKLLLESGPRLLVNEFRSFILESPVLNSIGDVAGVFDDTVWRVEAFAPPTSVVNTIPLLEILGEPNLLEIFGVSNYDQPFATFKSLWFDHPLAAYRLAGFALAMIYRTETIRNANYGRR